MPNHKSNYKRMRTNEKARQNNRGFRSRLRAVLKEVRTEESKEAAIKKLHEAESLLDKAAAKGIIHTKNASRNKSRLNHFVQKLS